MTWISVRKCERKLLYICYSANTSALCGAYCLCPHIISVSTTLSTSCWYLRAQSCFAVYFYTLKPTLQIQTLFSVDFLKQFWFKCWWCENSFGYMKIQGSLPLLIFSGGITENFQYLGSPKNHSFRDLKTVVCYNIVKAVIFSRTIFAIRPRTDASVALRLQTILRLLCCWETNKYIPKPHQSSEGNQPHPHLNHGLSLLRSPHQVWRILQVLRQSQSQVNRSFHALRVNSSNCHSFLLSSPGYSPFCMFRVAPSAVNRVHWITKPLYSFVNSW